MISIEKRAQISEAVSEVVDMVGYDCGLPPSGLCLVAAAAGKFALEEAGAGKVIVQAGTAMFPRVDPEQDDGVSATHFSYVWDDEKKNVDLDGPMPEIHVWLALKEPCSTWNIVDFTTRYQRAQCENVGRMKWLGKDLPPYLWCDALPDRWIYRPSERATLFALAKMQRAGWTVVDLRRAAKEMSRGLNM